MDQSSVVVLIPVLSRPERAAKVAESIEATTPEPHRTLFICTPRDHGEIGAVRTTGAEWILGPEWEPGDYQRKINLGYARSSEPYIFLGADDLCFHPGWLPAALAKMTEGIGVVGTNDLGSPRVLLGLHSTHSLVARDYVTRFGTIDEPGKILYEGYPHEFCDDELVGTAKARNAWAFAADSRVEHLHPHWGKAETDPIYGEYRQRMRRGRPMFEWRRPLWEQPCAT